MEPIKLKQQPPTRLAMATKHDNRAERQLIADAHYTAVRLTFIGMNDFFARNSKTPWVYAN